MQCLMMGRSTLRSHHLPQVGILPARYDSSRFPGKPLIPLLGKPMILHTYDQVGSCPLERAVAGVGLSLLRSVRVLSRESSQDNPGTISQALLSQACKATTLDAVVVATDDERIASVCRAHGAQVVMTRPDCPNGKPEVHA